MRIYRPKNNEIVNVHVNDNIVCVHVCFVRRVLKEPVTTLSLCSIPITVEILYQVTT